ncbi:importin alpha re-exporter [Coniophora puteana RWD-64-598 SS2]|uniref:Importin alpha re-exporter n=1 Tax=Coniophora puteana (strain RWD-64-598) TaxID=741705 RepID=R7SDY6_CONPW|nr:importin alpha re-exporter [Coniophora puteana RWD-64-598 SS2]EIW74080.1 importin alpha re-exporter [Coniophora puteana RWD-64-598 SS2]
MSDLAALLKQSLDPATRKPAEAQLTDLTSQPGFLPALLALVLDSAQDVPIRLAGAIYIKNIARTRWDEDVNGMPEADKAALRSQLVPALLALSGPRDRAIRAQIAESVALVAEVDFPDRWPELIDHLVNSLSPTNYTATIAILEASHAIFSPWRSQVRSDALFTTINIVLSRFVEPFIALFRHTANLVLSPDPNAAAASAGVSLEGLAQAQILLVEIFHDLTCQDLPPAIEDSHKEFFDPTQGWWIRFLPWDPPQLRVDEDEPTPSLPAKLKTRVFELGELYIKLYPDLLQQGPFVEALVQGVWTLIGGDKAKGVGDDSLVSQALHFISTALRSGHYTALFSAPETIPSLIRGVVLPNAALRTHEVELLEDDPLEYVRRDLASVPGVQIASLGIGGGVGAGGSGAAASEGTRRQAAADVLQALVSAGFGTETTSVVGRFVTEGLAAYAGNPAERWQAKNSAVFLFGAVAVGSGSVQHGITSTNSQVDVVQFFSENVYADLEAQPGQTHPVLQIDAIRFLLMFRNQLTKHQLLSVLPLLVRHLSADMYVVYTYAAITIDRILALKRENRLLFSQADIHEAAPELLNAVLAKIEKAGTPEKVAENDHLMKCAMRVIVTARQTLTPVYQQTLQRLVQILGTISKNPSNPNFDQYIFESISALIRFVVAGNPSTLPTFEQALFGPFTFILQQDIDQYIPYVFQILSQMLEGHATGVPTEYRSLLPFLLTPACWQAKGNIPGLVRLLRAFLARDATEMVRQSQVAAVLAVIQQRLIPSKINDGWGFELLQSVVENVPPAQLKQFFRPIIVVLLTRMQSSKTDKYVYLFSYFLLFCMAIDVQGLGPDYVISTVEEVQVGLWSQILVNFVVPQAPIVPHRDRKVAVVGLTRMLTQSEIMLQGTNVQAWPQAFASLVKLFAEPQYLKKASEDTIQGAEAGVTQIDFEEQTAGYQAAYSRLAASEAAQTDPVAYVRDPRAFVAQALNAAPPRVRELLGAADQSVVGPFLSGLANAA